MNISNRIFNNPDAGTYFHRKAVLVLDDSSTSLPSSLIADGVQLSERARVLFTGLSDATKNNRIYEVAHGALVLDADGQNPNGDSSQGEVVYVQQGTHAGKLWGYENNAWEVLDVDVDTSDDGGGSGNIQYGATRFTSANTTLSATTDRSLFVDTVAAGGDVTITMPPGVNGQEFFVKEIGGNLGTKVLFVADGSDTMGTNSDITNEGSNAVRHFQFFGGTWHVMNGPF